MLSKTISAKDSCCLNGSWTCIQYPITYPIVQCLRIETETAIRISDSKIIVQTDVSSTSHLFLISVFILMIIVFLVGSALCSGLNIGLMSLSIRQLESLSMGTDKIQRKRAETILALRSKGNILLVAILLGNVGFNSMLSVFLDQVIGSGMMAVVISTLIIVLFAEIVPQSLCLKHALFFGYYTRYFMYLILILTFPVSYPIGKFLDWTIGEPEQDVPSTIYDVIENVRDLTSDVEAELVESILTHGSNVTLKDIMSPVGSVEIEHDLPTFHESTKLIRVWKELYKTRKTTDTILVQRLDEETNPITVGSIKVSTLLAEILYIP